MFEQPRSAQAHSRKKLDHTKRPHRLFLRITHAYRCPQAREKLLYDTITLPKPSKGIPGIPHGTTCPIAPPPLHHTISHQSKRKKKKRNHKAIPTRLASLPATISSSTGVSGVIIKLLLYRFEVVGEDSRVYKTESSAVAEEFVERLLWF